MLTTRQASTYADEVQASQRTRSSALELLAEVVDPLGGRLEAAEGIEVQLHLAVLGRVEAVLERADELVRAGLAEQVGHREAVLLGDRGRGGHAESRGEPEQPLDAGRAGHADADGEFYPATADLCQP